MYSEVAALAPFVRGRAPLELEPWRVRRAIALGDLLIARRGVLVGAQYAAAVHPHVVAIEAALADLRRGSPACACLGSAALLHRISRLGRDPARVRLYRERGGPWRDEGVAVLVCGLPPAHVQVLDGVRATTRDRTAIDLARWVSFRSAVVVLDSALQLGSDRAGLERVRRDCRRWPGIRSAGRALEFADGRAQTPLESISRVVFWDAGLPVPRLQVPLPDGEAPVGIVDFYWDEFGVIGEADGLVKYDDALDPHQRSLRKEKLRQEALEGLGFTVVRWSWDDIWRRPEWVVGRLRGAFRKRHPRRAG